MLEVKGEILFKTVAYHRAADAIEQAPFDVAEAYAAGDRRPIAGVGSAIGDKIVELATTGRMAFHDRLRAEMPATLVDLLAIPGVGPKTVRAGLGGPGRRDRATTCARAAEAGQLRGLKGISAGTEQRILEGIAAARGAPAPDAPRPGAGDLGRPRGPARGRARASRGSSRRARSAGGARRWATSTCSSRPTDPTPSSSASPRLGGGRPRAGRRAREGGGRAARRAAGGPDGDAARRGGHVPRPLHGLGGAQRARCGGSPATAAGACPRRASCASAPTASRSTGDAAELRTFPDEAGVYGFLDLAFVPPELREDRGEIEAARERPPAVADHPGRPARRPALPLRLERRRPHDRGHGRGRPPPRPRLPGAHRPLAEPRHRPRPGARARGAAARDHRGAQRPVRGRGGGGHDCPTGADPGGFRLLHGCELEVRADGTLDYEDDLLARFDLVVASVHVARRQTREELTRRTLNAIRSPHVDVIAHPSGRMIQRARRPRPRLGRGLRGRRGHRHRARDQRVAAPAGPRAGARAPGGRGGLPARDRLRRAPDRGARLPALGRGPGAAGVGRAAPRAERAAASTELLAWVAAKPSRV